MPPTPPDDLKTSALSEVRGIFPGAEARVQWAEWGEDRAVVVVAVELDDGRYLHQVGCLRESGLWHSWVSGTAPGYLETDPPFGVVTRCDPLEPRTTAVRLRHFGDERVVEVDGCWLFQALWDVTLTDGEWSWAEPTKVLVDER